MLFKVAANGGCPKTTPVSGQPALKTYRNAKCEYLTNFVPGNRGHGDHDDIKIRVGKECGSLCCLSLCAHAPRCSGVSRTEDGGECVLHSVMFVEPPPPGPRCASGYRGFAEGVGVKRANLNGLLLRDFVAGSVAGAQVGGTCCGTLWPGACRGTR